MPGVVHSGPASRWRITRIAQTGSTNADLRVLALAGQAEGAVLLADTQTAGRGRLDRDWVSPPGASISCSVLLRPEVPGERWVWLPLLAGIAVADGVRAACPELRPRLKWPNDVLLGELKVCGILAEVVLGAGSAVILGFGINVNLDADQLPVPTATSLRLESGTPVDREAVIDAVLAELATRYADWVRHDGDPAASGLAAAYRERCATIGWQVRVERPGATPLIGQAVAVGDDGRLVVRDERVDHRLAAGDVVHVRRA